MNDIELATRIQEVIMELTGLSASSVSYRAKSQVMPTDYLLIFDIDSVTDIHLNDLNINNYIYALKKIVMHVWCFGSDSKAAMEQARSILKSGRKVSYMATKGLMWQNVYDVDVEKFEKQDETLIVVPNYSCEIDVWVGVNDVTAMIPSSITLKDNLFPDTTYTGGD